MIQIFYSSWTVQLASFLPFKSLKKIIFMSKKRKKNSRIWVVVFSTRQNTKSAVNFAAVSTSLNESATNSSIFKISFTIDFIMSKIIFGDPICDVIIDFFVISQIFEMNKIRLGSATFNYSTFMNSRPEFFSNLENINFIYFLKSFKTCPNWIWKSKNWQQN